MSGAIVLCPKLTMPERRAGAVVVPRRAISELQGLFRVFVVGDGDAAVVAFKLVGVPANGTETLYYYNTGTFLKRNGTWKAVAWQATKIPSAAGS